MPRHSLHRAYYCLVPIMLTATSAMADCTCRAGGRDYKLGERICLSGRAVICGMDQNVSSWKTVNEPCAVSTRPSSLYLAAAGHVEAPPLPRVSAPMSAAAH